MGIPLVVTADDFGLTRATCDAIVEAHRHGIVTATSVLAVGSAVDHGLARAVELPDLSVGVHLALVGEDRPLSPPETIGSLVDGAGRLAPSWRQVLPRLATGRVDLAEVAAEAEAQIARVAMQRRVSHLDTHQHLHLWPPLGRLVVDLAVAHGIPAVRVPRSRRAGPRGRAIGRWADDLDRYAARRGVATTSRFAGLDEAGRWRVATLVQALRDHAAESGSLEINVHPGAAVDAERERFAWSYSWDAERRALCAPEVRWAVGRLGFELQGR